MRVGLDARSLFAGGTGDRTYFRHLIKAMARLQPRDEFVLFHREDDPERAAFARELANVRASRVDFPIGWLWGPLALPPRLKAQEIDVLHAQYLLPPKCPCPSIVMIHDITFRLFPQWVPPRARVIMNLLIPLAARTSTRILTSSEHSRRDIVRHLKVPPEKVVVTLCGVGREFAPMPPGAATQRVEEKFGLKDYIIGIGLRGARKNIGVVLRAMLQLQAQGKWPRDCVLALAGSREQFPDVELDQLGAQVRFLGYVADEELPALYGAALACVYPSFYEGFGLPPLEAMACGCPVLCANASSLPEVVGQAALLLPPHDRNAWADALERALTDAAWREAKSEAGLHRALLFDWNRSARQTLAVYREVQA